MSNVEGFSVLFSHSRCSREGICTGRILDWLEKTPVSCNLTTCLRVERQKHLQVPRVATLAEGAAKLFLPLLFKVALMMSVHLKSQSLLIGVNPASAMANISCGSILCNYFPSSPSSFLPASISSNHDITPDFLPCPPPPPLQ